MANKLRSVVTGFIGVVLCQVSVAQNGKTLENENWKLWYDGNKIESIVNKKDSLSPVFPGHGFGDVLVNYKVENGMWQTISSESRVLDVHGNTIQYSDTAMGEAIVLTQSFELKDNGVEWHIKLQNFSQFPILLGDIAPTFPWMRRGVRGSYSQADEPERTPNDLFLKNFTKHHFIQGDGSFIYYTRFGGEFPAYIWTTTPGTPLEYWNNNEVYRAYIYAGKAGNEEQKGTWRQEHTYGNLAPAGQKGDEMEFAFNFKSANSYAELRNIIYNEGLIDIRTLPGMTLPRTQYGYFSLHTKCKIDSVVSEFPSETVLESLGELTDNTYGYRVKFSKLGENKITVYFDGGRKSYLEYFSSLSPEDLTKKRASFLVNTQQVRDSSKWYDGLYAPYDMKEGVLRTPDNPGIYDRIRTYFIASDDPALGKAPFLASKNEVFPDDSEIASLEYHIKNFVWGGLQRTDQETPYAYGIYGTPNFLINRNMALKDTQGNYKKGTLRAWRSFDYVHVVMMYYHMYHIAKMYPEKCHYLDADGYLERAYQTAVAYFHYPTELLGEYYETFKWGCYNELVIPGLIEDLEAEGRVADADVLRGFWERKAKFFIYDDKYPYHSEYEMDRTAFESSYALVEYAMQHKMPNDDSLWYDNNEKVWYSHPNVNQKANRDFMERQYLANLSCRGVLESEWNTLGSDFFYSSDGSEHSYMSRMGGWGVLNYALRFDKYPNDDLNLGYASYLASYGIVNAGDDESNYGYWYPGKEKDGAMGQAYTSSKVGHPWVGNEEARGPWRHCGEGDLGMCAITRTATSVLVRDSIFGWSYYGGNIEKIGKSLFKLYPDDGVRQDLWLLVGKRRLHIHLERDNFAKEQPIVVDVAKCSAKLIVENGVATEHCTKLFVEAVNCKTSLKADGTVINAVSEPRERVSYTFNVGASQSVIEIKF